MADDSGKGGRPDVVQDEEVLRTLYQCDDPVMSAPELAEEFRIGDTGMYKKLRRMEDEGLVASKKIARGRAWWLTDEGVDAVEDED